MSLVEALLVVMVVSSMTFLIAGLPNALGLINKSKHLSIAREIATKQIEDKRAQVWDDLVNEEVSINDSRLTLLPQGSGMVKTADCEVQICPSGELTKQITIQVSWQDNAKTQTIALKTLVSKGGLTQ